VRNLLFACSNVTASDSRFLDGKAVSLGVSKTFLSADG
jgi:hypothetical protein